MDSEKKINRSGQVAVVLGGSGGLGLGMARRFGIDGAKVVLADIDLTSLEAARGLLFADGFDVLAVQTDISIATEVARLVELTLRKYGQVDVACNAVGVSGHEQKRIWEMTERDWRWHFDVNVWGVIHVIQSFAPVMVAAGSGHIINSASSVTFSSRSGYAHYDASKHAVISLCESLHHDLKTISSGVKSSVLIPGAIRSQMYRSEAKRQEHYGKGATTDNQRAVMQAYLDDFGADPDVLAEILDVQLDAGKFYVFGRPEDIHYAELRLAEIKNGFLGSSSFLRVAGPGSTKSDE